MPRAADRATVVAVCDLDGDRAAAVARELGARAYTRLGDLLADPDVAAVDLTLPHHVHYEAASAALAAGRHVLVEKPLALTSDECRSLIEQAREASLTLGVAENTRFVAAYLAVERLLRSGALGEPRLARTFISGSEVARLRDTSLWKGRPQARAAARFSTPGRTRSTSCAGSWASLRPYARSITG